MGNRDIIVIGTSAGGVEALRFLAKSFSPSLPASILVTIHLPSQFRSVLDEILSRAGPIPAAFASHGEAMQKGRIYIAPPGSHLLVEGWRLALGTGPRENNTRPAIDPMLRSAAICCGGRTVAVVLTGTLGDGASGLAAVSQCGGITVVQDPEDAAFPEMPLSALEQTKADHVVPLSKMPALLESLIHQPAGETKAIPARLRHEVEIARSGKLSMDKLDRWGQRSVLSCPECGGVLWEVEGDENARYRCHIGHAYTAGLVSLGIDENVKRALGTALRALDERSALARKLRDEALRNGRNALAEQWSAREGEFSREAAVIDDVIRRIDKIAGNVGAQRNAAGGATDKAAPA